MKRIPLTQGYFAIVDDEDYAKVSKHNWYISNGYARSRVKGKSVSMHRYIMNPRPDMQIDHLNGKRPDNRKCNLRICTRSENLHNHISSGYGRSNFLGVYYQPRGDKWCSQITHNRRVYHLGSYNTEIKAAKAYDKKAKELYGEFAFQNI